MITCDWSNFWSTNINVRQLSIPSFTCSKSEAFYPPYLSLPAGHEWLQLVSCRTSGPANCTWSHVVALFQKPWASGVGWLSAATYAQLQMSTSAWDHPVTRMQRVPIRKDHLSACVWWGIEVMDRLVKVRFCSEIHWSLAFSFRAVQSARVLPSTTKLHPKKKEVKAFLNLIWTKRQNCKKKPEWNMSCSAPYSQSITQWTAWFWGWALRSSFLIHWREVCKGFSKRFA